MPGPCVELLSYSASAPVAQVDRQACVSDRRPALVVQTLQKPYRDLLELQLQDLTAHVEPNHDNMFLIATKQRDASAIDSGGIVVALRNCSLRDQWLQALVTSRVDVTVCWQPSADKSLCHGGGCGDSPVHRNKKTSLPKTNVPRSHTDGPAGPSVIATKPRALCLLA